MLVNKPPLPLDTGVLIAIAAAAGSWDILATLQQPIVITQKVLQEIRRGRSGSPATDTPISICMTIWEETIQIPQWLTGVLDEGEASVIALALSEAWPEVGIDEAVGRSVAKTCGLRLTGSLGLLVRAKRNGYAITMRDAISRIRAAGIWIGKDVEHAALRIAGEKW